MKSLVDGIGTLTKGGLVVKRPPISKYIVVLLYIDYY